MASESLKQAYIEIINEELNKEKYSHAVSNINPDDITVEKGNPIYFPKGNENGDYYEPLYIASHDAIKGGFHGRTPAEAKNNLLTQQNEQIKKGTEVPFFIEYKQLLIRSLDLAR